MKTLFLTSLVFCITLGLHCQTPDPGTSSAGGNQALRTTSTPTVVTDALHYYYNKYRFKTGVSNLAAFPYYLAPALTPTNITHCGSKFEVPAGETVTVTGLEAYVGFYTESLAQTNIGVNLFLCYLDGNGNPIISPPVDSIVGWVDRVTVHTPTLVGGEFTHTTSASPTVPVLTPRTMTANFAVLYRNMSGNSGDTLCLLRTAGATYTNMAATPEQRSSDTDFGYVRHNGQFYSTRDYNLDPGFGPGTDYEFMVAPRVTYSIQASHMLPQHVIPQNDPSIPDTICTRTLFTFTNTSSKFYEHRMYNLNQFYRKWNLYSEIKPHGNFSDDSTFTWSFEFYQQPGQEDRVWLPYVNSGTVTAITDRPSFPGCFDANEFRACLRPMDINSGAGQMKYTERFKVCMKFCNGDAVGIASIDAMTGLRIYPNPSVNGKTYIEGLEGKNTVIVYNTLGQPVITRATEDPFVEIDLSGQPLGAYSVRVLNARNFSKLVKIINQ